MLIGELGAATGVGTKTLRFYEAEGLLAEPARTSNGYRDYRDEAVGRVLFIRRAQAAGLTLAQISQVLAIRDDGHSPCAHVADLVEQRLDEVSGRLDELARTRDELISLRERLAALDPVDCHDDTICAAIGEELSGPVE